MYVGHKNHVILVEQNALLSSISQNVKLTDGIEKKIGFYTCAHIMRPKKYNKPFENLKL